MTREEFLATVERHLTETGMAATTFGKRAVGDPSFVFTLRRGRSPNLTIVERVLNFIGTEVSTPAETSESAAQ